MKKRLLLKLLFFSLLSISCLLLFSSKIGNIPPLAKFLNPFSGFWQNAESSKITARTKIQLKGLKNPVSILIDTLGVPHIFAETDYDLYYAQGYITARDRLWQLDFQSRYASGRLAEIIGKKAIELDRYQRRMGMLFGAEKMLEESRKDKASYQALLAYSDGINAYIHELKPKNYPIEFKILDYKPEKWTLLNTALLLKLMSATLASRSDEMKMSNIREIYGIDIVQDLFPNYPFKEDPIIPTGTPWHFEAQSHKADPHPYLPVQATKSTNIQTNNNLPEELYSRLLTVEKDENIGSNNWAIAGNRTQTSMPILANDPHLNLTLPSIWYQIQLHTPQMNVSGVSLPGAPGVIIGFNENIAWGVTNVGSDVLDWYQVNFKDESCQEYLFDGRWKKTTNRIEEIKVRNGDPILDTVFYTHHGPVSYTTNTKPRDFEPARQVPINFALKWVAHLPSNEIKTFLKLNRAKTYEDYQEALTHYTAPAQNFIFANNQQDISITSNGFFPAKEKEHGKFLLDASKPQDDWKGEIPFEHKPTIKNPDRGFVSSANQSPTDQTYPYYLNWQFAPYERGHRINQVLSTFKNASVDDFINLQNDDYSILAENVLKELISIIDDTKLTSKEYESLATLKSWNLHYASSSIAASIFETWFNTLTDFIWYDKFGKPDMFMRYPSRDRTVQLILYEPESPWYFNKFSQKYETQKDVVNLSFKKTIEQLSSQYGDLLENWRWSKVKKTHVPHLANISGFGSRSLEVGGTTHTINAMSESNGPSWRMVVALGKEPTAYGVLPGGQSGNPGSKFYDNQLSAWEQGKLHQLIFLKNTDEHSEAIITRITLTPN